MTNEISAPRQASPKTKIYVQVSAPKGTPQQMQAALSTIGPRIDGIAVWSPSQFQSQLMSFVKLIRPATSVIGSNVARR
jgi:hypothetical protein